jgi:hypothetical protein
MRTFTRTRRSCSRRNRADTATRLRRVLYCVQTSCRQYRRLHTTTGPCGSGTVQCAGLQLLTSQAMATLAIIMPSTLSHALYSACGDTARRLDLRLSARSRCPARRRRPLVGTIPHLPWCPAHAWPSPVSGFRRHAPEQTRKNRNGTHAAEALTVNARTHI